MLFYYNASSVKKRYENLASDISAFFIKYFKRKLTPKNRLGITT